jgi:hypothetical protein
MTGSSSAIPAWLIPLATPILTAAIADLQGYISARKSDPTTKFDWVLFLSRIAISGMIGLMAMLGQNYVTS